MKSEEKVSETANKSLERVLKDFIDNERSQAKLKLSGKQLEDALHGIDQVELASFDLVKEANSASDNPQAMRLIAEERLSEVIKRRHIIEAEFKDRERETALERNDADRKRLENEIDVLKIYDAPPSHFPKKRVLMELSRMQKTLKHGTAREKEGIINIIERERTQIDALKKHIRKKLNDPAYSQAVIAEFKSRKLKFRMASLMIVFSTILSIVFAGYLGRESPTLAFVIFIMALIAAAALYALLGNKLYRCPACNDTISFHSRYSSHQGQLKMNTSKINACPKCGAPFR